MFVFLIGANPLVSSYLEVLAKQMSRRFYYLPNLQEAAFFIEDLRPDVIVVDESQLDRIDPSMSYGPHFSSVPVVILGKSFSLKEINVVGNLPKPVDGQEFFNQVEYLVASFKKH